LADDGAASFRSFGQCRIFGIAGPLLLSATEWSQSKYSIGDPSYGGPSIPTKRNQPGMISACLSGLRPAWPCRDLSVAENEFRRSVREPLGKREVLINAGLKHFQKFQIGSAGIFDVMAAEFSGYTDITRFELHGAGSAAGSGKRSCALCRQRSNTAIRRRWDANAVHAGSRVSP